MCGTIRPRIKRYGDRQPGDKIPFYDKSGKLNEAVFGINKGQMYNVRDDRHILSYTADQKVVVPVEYFKEKDQWYKVKDDKGVAAYLKNGEIALITTHDPDLGRAPLIVNL